MFATRKPSVQVTGYWCGEFSTQGFTPEATMDDMDKGRRRLIRLENVDVLARVIPIGQSSVLWHGFALLNQVHAYTH